MFCEKSRENTWITMNLIISQYKSKNSNKQFNILKNIRFFCEKTQNMLTNLIVSRYKSKNSNKHFNTLNHQRLLVRNSRNNRITTNLIIYRYRSKKWNKHFNNLNHLTYFVIKLRESSESQWMQWFLDTNPKIQTSTLTIWIT